MAPRTSSSFSWELGIVLTFGKRRMPTLIQAESAECGICCVGMIAGYHGNQRDLISLRRKLGLSLRGATLRNIMEMSETLCLSARPLRVEIEELPKMKLPAILHWDLNHFVVLSKITKGGIVIHDPAIGVRRYTLAEASNHFTGIALELTPRPDFEPGENQTRLGLSALWAGSTGLSAGLFQILLLSLLIQVFSLATPFYMQIVVDDVLIKHDADLLTVLALGFVCLVIISVITKALRAYSSLYLVNQLNYNIGNRILHHLIRLPMDYFEKRHMGDIVSRFSSVKPVQEFITGGLIAVFIDGLLAVTTFGLMLLYAPLMAAVVLGSVVIYAIFRAAQFFPLRSANHENIAAEAKLNSIFMESVRTLQGIKLAGKELDRQNTWRNQFAASINTNAKIGRLTISYEAANNALTGLEYVAVIYLGALLVLSNQMSVGMLYAFMAYRSNFSNSVISIINQFVQYKMLGLHLERLADITETNKEAGLQNTSTLLLPVNGALTAKDLAFSYASSEPLIIDKFNIQIESGQMVAMFGPSGSGKSTLLKILVGLLPPSKGEILVDNLPLNTLGQKTYRSSIAALMQDDRLFSGSLSENISFFDLVPDHQQIQEVCKLVNIHDEILNTPMGYDSLIGDMGSSLSMGQQQRVLLARALYRKPKILFLDEGTAHVDALSEQIIMQNLKSLGITVIYVTHNEKILAFANTTLVWQDKEIAITEGIHENQQT